MKHVAATRAAPYLAEVEDHLSHLYILMAGKRQTPWSLHFFVSHTTTPQNTCPFSKRYKITIVKHGFKNHLLQFVENRDVKYYCVKQGCRSDLALKQFDNNSIDNKLHKWKQESKKIISGAFYSFDKNNV